jgi:hypothetical protein
MITTTLEALRSDLAQRGIVLTIVGESLRLDAPLGAVDASLRERLTLAKPALIAAHHRHAANDAPAPQAWAASAICNPDLTPLDGHEAGMARLRAYAAREPDSGLDLPYDWRAWPSHGNPRRSTVAGVIENARRNRESEFRRQMTDGRERSLDEAQRNPGAIADRVTVDTLLVVLDVEHHPLIPDS